MLQEPTNGKNLLIHILSDSIIPVELVAGVPPFNNPNFFIDKKGTIFLFKHFWHSPSVAVRVPLGTNALPGRQKYPELHRE